MIIFPMAGRSSRFFNAGYSVPKFMLELDGRPVFDHVVSGFHRYFGTELLVFVCRSDFDTPKFIRTRLYTLGLTDSDYCIVELDQETRGQADTIMRSLDRLPSEKDVLTIFNVDTIRHNFRYLPPETAGSSGYLEVLEANGDHWSFVLPEEKQAGSLGRVRAVAEKKRISNLCSTGLYHFDQASTFKELYQATYRCRDTTPTILEEYVAPLYETGLRQGLQFTYLLLKPQQIDFCGTPDEYEALRTKEID
jgi:NDP-sugar pyrophosphorylase family protein